MTGPGLFPSLDGWMAGTAADHPLREWYDRAGAGDAATSPRRMILGALDTIIGRLEAAQPAGLPPSGKTSRTPGPPMTCASSGPS